jgi:hypothetical protein
MGRKAKAVQGFAARIGAMYLSKAGQWAPLSLENTQLFQVKQDAEAEGRKVLGELLPDPDYFVSVVQVETRLCVAGLDSGGA